MKKKSGKNTLLTICIIFFGAVFIFSAYKLWTIFSEYKAGEDVYDQVTDTVISKPSGTEQIEEKRENVPIQVDFDALREVNPDVIGWLYSEDTVINYPVVQGDDNEYYLHHLINGEYNGSGTIFVDVNNSPDLTDDNTIIYGHHMKNGSMFKSIVGYRKQEYYDAHPVMYFLTPERDYRIELFAGYTTPADSDTYTFVFANKESFMSYISECISQSDFSSNTEVTENDRIITLSTCTYEYSDARYVVQGRLVEIER